MSVFLHAHATHPDWQFALAMVNTQLQSQQAQHWGEAGSSAATLGWVYITDHHNPHGQALLSALQTQWPGVSWVGTVGVGVAACGVEYFDEPGMAVMLTRLPRGAFQVFSGAKPLNPGQAWTALVHADPRTPDLADLIAEMSDRTESGYLFGGLTASRGKAWQFADGAWEGGLSGVAFSQDVRVLSRVTQGSQPLGPLRTVTGTHQHLVTELDGRPALECLAADLKLDLSDPRSALPRLRGTLVGLRHPQRRAADARPDRAFGPDVQVRHLIGLDPSRQAVVVADEVQLGMQLAFCQRDAEAARRDLVRVCAEIREELSGDDWDPHQPPPDPAERIAGAVYVSCSGRGGPHFGGPSAELQLVQHALGSVPLVGFFAAGEIGHHHLYGYTGVLTVFVRDPVAPPASGA